MKYIYIFCILFVLGCIALLIFDIVMAVYCQFRSKNYEWYSIKVIKGKREWWKWVISICAFAVGIYAIIPNSVTGKADFRADLEKPSYTAYYECEYSSEHFGKGKGYISVIKENGKYKLGCLYTDYGRVYLDCTYEEDISESLSFYICEGDHQCKVKIGNGPVNDAVVYSEKYDAVFGYPDCSDENMSFCARCYEPCEKWPLRSDDYVICEYCLTNLFEDEWLRDFIWKYEFGN